MWGAVRQVSACSWLPHPTAYRDLHALAGPWRVNLKDSKEEVAGRRHTSAKHHRVAPFRTFIGPARMLLHPSLLSYRAPTKKATVS